MASVGFVFPGQGSQSLKMLADYVPDHSIVSETFAQASSVLGYDIWALCQNGPESQLNQTQFTQPAMLVADVALWRLWCSRTEVRPSVVAGHSLGEYAALVAAQAIAFEDAVSLVSKRGQFMQEAVPAGGGAMAALIGITVEDAERLCHEQAKGDVLSLANINSIGQIVVAGDKVAVQRAVDTVRDYAGRMAVLIPVSVPAHCELMGSAASLLKEELFNANFSSPEVRVIHNVDLSSQSDPAIIHELLVEQMTSPVQWVGTIEKYIRNDISLVVECGPGNVLQGLNKRISKDLKTISLSTPALFDRALEQVEDVMS